MSRETEKSTKVMHYVLVVLVILAGIAGIASFGASDTSSKANQPLVEDF